MDILSKIAYLKDNSGLDFDDDLFVGMLASLVGKQHAIVTVSSEEYLDYIEQMILLIGSNIFGFNTSSVVCSPEMSSREFANALLVSTKHVSGSFSPLPSVNTTSLPDPNYSELDNGLNKFQNLDQSSLNLTKKFPNLIVIRELDKSNNYVQARLLEILRSKKLVTSQGVVITSFPFLVIPLLVKTSAQVQLFPYLLDHFFISHNYEPSIPVDIDESKKFNFPLSPYSFQCLVSVKDIESISSIANNVIISAEIRRYMHDVIVHLRLHRAVGGGISARASKDMELFVKCLAPLHGINFATPILVSIATRKVYSHRLAIPLPEEERTMIYGSDLDAVKNFLQHWTADLVIDDVISSVAAPM
ncbi:hypothetical protein V1514DRAFT_350877 [Lipomyces japonicus]|uniref:uncharacterized protein n=1 Tax=Lipomyces japonicus TaxID=56871 RepID=UPI0034CE3BF0